MPMLEDKGERAYLDRCLKHYARTREDLDDLATGEPGRTPIHPQDVAKLVSELASDSAIVTCDVGTAPPFGATRFLSSEPLLRNRKCHYSWFSHANG